MTQSESRTFEMVVQRLANKEDKRSKKAKAKDEQLKRDAKRRADREAYVQQREAQRLADKEAEQLKRQQRKADSEACRKSRRAAHKNELRRKPTQEEPVYDPYDWPNGTPTMGDRLAKQQCNLRSWLRGLAAAAEAEDGGMVRWIWRDKDKYVLDTSDEETLNHLLSYPAKVFIKRALR